MTKERHFTVKKSYIMHFGTYYIRVFSRFLAGLIYLPIIMFFSNLKKNDFDIISMDVFGTLIERKSDEHYAWRAGATKTGEIARRNGLDIPDNLYTLRRKIERDVSRDLISRGKDCEFKNEQIIEAMLRRLGAGDWAIQAASEIASWEFLQELSCTKAQDKIVQKIAKFTLEGRKIIAVSDTRYSSTQIEKLLNFHGIKNISRVYASTEYGVNKFSGRLFDVVLHRENVKNSKILHIGDNIKSDILSASQRGLAVCWTRRPPAPELLPEADPIIDCNTAFKFGYESIGPVIVGFTRLLFDRAREDRIENLAYVARDGYLLLKVAEILRDKLSHESPTLSYLHLSRRAVVPASPELVRMAYDQNTLEEFVGYIDSLSGETNLIVRLQNYFGLIGNEFLDLSKELGLARGDQADLRALLNYALAKEKIKNLTEPLQKKLKSYLLQENVFSSRTGVVDIGWRGTIHNAVQNLAKHSGLPSPRAYYFGYWNISRNSLLDPSRFGVISDQRRKKGLLEGSSWQCVPVLESVCRADHGMVVGFVESDKGVIIPQHVQSGNAREAESLSLPAQKAIQEGVLAYAQWFAEKMPVSYPQTLRVRKEVQRSLFKLAFFPNHTEREVGKLLTHSDPTDDQWALPLIVEPSGGFKGWVSGIQSPWKGGYFRSYGGLLVAAAYCAVEAVFSYTSNDTKLAVGRWVLRRKQ